MEIHIYAVASFLMLVLFILDNRINNSVKKKIFFYAGAFIITFLLAFRGDHIGGDTDAYCGYFDGSGGSYGTIKTRDYFEWGFQTFAEILAYVSRSSFWFIFSTSLVTILPFLYLVNRDTKGSKILPLCIYMMAFDVLSVTQTAIRQNLSISFFMVAYIVWTSKFRNLKFKYFLTLFFLIFGFFTHSTSFVALPLVIISMFIPFSKKSALITVISSFVILFMTENLFNDIFNLFNSYMQAFDFSQHLIETYYGNPEYQSNSKASFNSLMPVNLLVILLIVLSKETEFKNIYLRFLIVGIALFNIGSQFTMSFRVLYPLLFAGIIYCPKYIKSPKNFLMRSALILLMLFFIRNQIIYLKPHQDSQMLPYNFIWEENRMNTKK